MNNMIHPPVADPLMSDDRDRPLATAQWYRFAPDAVPSFNQGDVWVGRTLDNHALGVNNKSHILVCAQARSGKGTSLILPNVLNWPGSLFVIDPKGEAAMVGARRRGRGSAYCVGLNQKVYILDPYNVVKRSDDEFEDMKAYYNPLDMVHEGDPEAIDNAARIADALTVKNQQDVFWSEAARDLKKALILHVASYQGYGPEERNLIKVRQLLQEGEAKLRQLMEEGWEDDLPSPFELLFDAMRKNPAHGGLVSRAGAQYKEQYLKSERTFFSIVQTAMTNTDFLDSPGIQEVLSWSSFDLADLKRDPRGVSVFLSLPQRMMNTHHRWLRLMTTLFLTEMERVPEQPANGHQILAVFDEFAGLGTMDVVTNAAAQIAGFGVKMLYIVQNLGQLQKNYPQDWQTYVANAATKVFFNNDDVFTREYVCKLIGEHEVVRRTNSESSTNSKGTNSSISISISSTEGETVGRSVGHSINHGPGGANGGSSSNNSHSVSYSTTIGTTITEGESTSESRTVGTNESIHKRPLVTQDELGRLFGRNDCPLALILTTGEFPLILRRSHYFHDGMFSESFDPHPDHPYPDSLIRKLQLARHEIATDWPDKMKEHGRVMKWKGKRETEAEYNRIRIKDREDATRQRHVAMILTVMAVIAFFLPTAFLGYVIRADAWFPLEDLFSNFPLFSAYRFATYLLIGLFWEAVAVATVLGIGLIAYLYALFTDRL